MDEQRRAAPQQPGSAPESRPTEADVADLRAANERLLLAGLREQALAAEARQLADRLAHQVLHDGLTGLPNRTHFYERLQRAMLSAQREGAAPALLFIDLDGFKAVNDRLGHQAGDLLLQQVAGRLRATLGEDDMIARLGGDEFGVLLPALVEPEGALLAARRILGALRPPCILHGLPQPIGASIGIAHYPADGADADALLRHADVAMYAAKRTHSAIAVAGFSPDGGDPAPSGVVATSPGGPDASIGTPGAGTREHGGTDSELAEIRAVNERLLVAGLREQELGDRLRHQLAFTSAITGNLGEGVLALDREGRITFANPVAGQLLGWRQEDMLGHDLHAIVAVPGEHDGDQRAADALFRGVVRSGVPHRDDDAVLRRRDGTTLPVAYSAAPIVAAGRVLGAVVAFRDIAGRKDAEARQQRINEELERQVRERTATLQAANARLQVELAARHQSEVALRERETRLRLMLEQTPAVIWTTDRELRFTFAAGANLAALGLGPASVVGRALPEVVDHITPDVTEQAGAADVTTVPAHRRALAGEPSAYSTVRGGRTFQAYVEPLRDPDGAIAGTIAIAQDITELSLRRLHDEFIATVSHQLLTPLAAARAGLGLLEVGVADRLRDEERRLLGTIGRNVGRLEIHLNDLITLNQLKTGTVPFAPDDLDLRAVVAEAMGVVQPLLREKGQELAVALPEPLPVAGDAEGLAQAVINLLANAHRYTPSGTRVTIAGQVVGDEVLLTVSDTGPGIPAGALETIFQRFHRLAVPADTAATGSGLGLAIVRGIVGLHGGRIWAESAVGHGATFHLALPRQAPEGRGEEASWA